MALPSRSTPIARVFPVCGLAFVLILAPGCGDDPSRLTGTIEMPERIPAPPIDAKSFLKEKANPKQPNQ